jgi:hypothetical protein
LQDAFAEIKLLKNKNKSLKFENKFFCDAIVTLVKDSLLFREIANNNQEEFKKFVKLLVDNLDDNDEVNFLIIEKYNELLEKNDEFTMGIR